MKWMDGHCDVLWKMWENPKRTPFYSPSSPLDAAYHHLQEASVAFQTFAIFVPEEVSRGARFEAALKQIDLFYEQICHREAPLFLVTSGEQLTECTPIRIGALLSLEGADALQGEITYLRTLHRLGVRQVGLTWNNANEAADGIQETRGGGLTRFGWEVVKEMKRLGMVLDVSHLSVKGFWNVMEQEDLPIIASHSNCRTLSPHVRNLEDGQIQALIERDGLIGITFVPSFVRIPGSEASIDQLLQHIEHVCNLGGANQLFFGSDFDGIESKIPGLENMSRVKLLKEELLKWYPEEWVEKWAWENGSKFYQKHLGISRVVSG